MEELKQLMPFFIIFGLMFAVGILIPLFSFLKEIFWVLIVFLIILIPIILIAIFIHKAYKQNENSGKVFVVILFAAFLIPQFVHPEVIDTRVTKADLEELKLSMGGDYETINQTLKKINEKELTCEQIDEGSENNLFIVFPIILVQIICTAGLVFFFRNR